MKTGIAISTYFSEKTPPGRLDIFKRSINSLLESGYTGKIFVVTDGPEFSPQIQWLLNFDISHRITKVFRPHGGISRTKNTCIRLLLDEGVDIGFLSDDDVLFKSKEWADQYVTAIEVTGIGHFSYFLETTPCEYPEQLGYVYRKTPSVNGCFLTFTKKLIDEIGYFKILPHEYGHEHSNFSIRAATIGHQGGFFDIIESDKHLELIQESIGCKSIGSVDSVKFKENEQSAILSEFKYEPFVE